MTHAPVNICRGGRLCPPETLDNAGRMGIIRIRGRCDKRSTLEVNDFSQNKKPSLGRVAVSAFQLHNSNRDGVPSDMKCKRPKHSLTPFRVVWLTACRFTQRPCGQYSSVGGICQISRCGRPSSLSINLSCHSEEHPKGTCFAARSDVGIRNLLVANSQKIAKIVRFGNRLPRQSADWLTMTPLRGVRGGRRCPARFHPHSTSCICSKYFRCSALVVRT